MILRKIDPRYFQIVTLASLIGIQFTGAFHPSPINIAIAFTSCIASYTVLWAVFLRGQYAFDPRSSLITAFSLSLLLKSPAWWIYAFAAVLGVASKFVIRFGGKHIFNPANIGIVTMILLFPQIAWITPGQWGNGVLLATFLTCMAFIVLFQVRSRIVSFMFLSFWALLTFGRALWLGDPLSIPVHQLYNGAFLIFTFFMISDPKTVPDHKIGQALFCAAVAILGFTLQFALQVREGLFYALAVMCILRPIIERYLPARLFDWHDTCIDDT